MACIQSYTCPAHSMPRFLYEISIQHLAHSCSGYHRTAIPTVYMRSFASFLRLFAFLARFLPFYFLLGHLKYTMIMHITTFTFSIPIPAQLKSINLYLQNEQEQRETAALQLSLILEKVPEGSWIFKSCPLLDRGCSGDGPLMLSLREPVGAGETRESGRGMGAGLAALTLAYVGDPRR